MEHPITPPSELVRQWAATNGTHYEDLATLLQSVATQAARWGADQELEACCDYMQREDFHGFAKELLAARRPKPPRLAEEALMGLEQTVIMLMPVTGRKKIERFAIIRRALERLKELEKGNE